MVVINMTIDADGVAESEGMHRMQPGDRILLTACSEFASVSGEYIAVNNNGTCHGCALEDVIDLVCTGYCGDCIIKKKEDILEDL